MTGNATVAVDDRFLVLIDHDLAASTITITII